MAPTAAAAALDAKQQRSSGDAGSAPLLVLNSGSSSLKFGVFVRGPDGDETLLVHGSADGIGHADGKLTIRSSDGAIRIEQAHRLESQSDALRTLADALQQHTQLRPAAVGHRLVHGGPQLREHQRLTDAVKQQLRGAVHFAPLHIPAALALVEQAEQIFAGVPHFACFDNAFHRTMPERAVRLPLPRRYFDAGVIHYGFHGLSYESLVHRLGESLPQRAVFAHLGSGSSVCAVQAGRSIDTSMGLTPTGGVPMATRSGDLDPGVLLYLMRTEALDAAALEQLLNHDCGLGALAGGESDMQKLIERSAGHGAAAAAARLAVDIFATAVRKTIGSYAALMGGLDLLVFTGGIGEHSAVVRRLICDGLQFLGIEQDAGAQADVAADTGIAASPSISKVRVLATEEDRQIARHCRGLLAAAL